MSVLAVPWPRVLLAEEIGWRTVRSRLTGRTWGNEHGAWMVRGEVP